jgi:hypothetical protein
MFFISSSLYRDELALVVTAAVEQQRTIPGLTKSGDKTVLETMISSLPPDGIDEDDVTASFAQTSETIYGSEATPSLSSSKLGTACPPRFLLLVRVVLPLFL